jgi:hypothetical protein
MAAAIQGWLQKDGCCNLLLQSPAAISCCFTVPAVLASHVNALM